MGDVVPLADLGGLTRDSVLLEQLKRHFGHSTFRPLQKEAIQALLLGRDVFVLLPTSAGKSLCYQLPAIMLGKVALCVSPLIALMEVSPFGSF